MNCAENYVKYLCKWLLEHCREDVKFISDKYERDGRHDRTAIERLELVSSAPFKRISYTTAVEILKNVEGRVFENKAEWGIDLASEHERYVRGRWSADLTVFSVT
jgi:asparaginyl-tRNA synthetase